MKMKRFGKPILCILLAIGICKGLCSCATPTPAQTPPPGTVSGNAEMAERTGAATEKDALLDCSFDLFRQTVERDGENQLFSPLSAVAVLAMIANGAKGETLAQIEAMLGGDLNTLNSYYSAFLHGLHSSEKCKVSFADSVWVREGDVTLRPEFVQSTGDLYDADIYEAAFDQQTIEDINHWVSQHTDDMIKEIIEEIDGDVVMYLINTLLFDAEWMYPYEENDISNGTFACYDKTTADVTYLDSKEEVYLHGNGFSGVVKSYSGGKYSFVGLLPDEGTDVYDLIDRLDGVTWQSAWASRQYATVHTRIPEFRFDCHTDLVETLMALGVTDLFDPSRADLSGMSNRELYCSKIEQKVAINVSRNGTEAAAATWATVLYKGVAPIQTEYVYLTRPFVFLIVDNMTGVPLFAGAVTHLD